MLSKPALDPSSAGQDWTAGHMFCKSNFILNYKTQSMRQRNYFKSTIRRLFGKVHSGNLNLGDEEERKHLIPVDNDQTKKINNINSRQSTHETPDKVNSS
uniref:Ion_trans_N domain-containing protein n=1 Tax=Strongyloides venezuelensis TaxID=75913 RepID=A0A0K0FZF5_STRVS